MFFLLFACAFDDALNPGRHFSPHIGTDRKPGFTARRILCNTLIRKVLLLLFAARQLLFAARRRCDAVAMISEQGVFAPTLFQNLTGRTNLITITRLQHRSRHFFASKQNYVPLAPDCIVLCQPKLARAAEHTAHSQPLDAHSRHAKRQFFKGREHKQRCIPLCY